ncbi:MAG: flagellar basal body P-ring formation chaperone FlgA [Pseudomonadota bacterium]
MVFARFAFVLFLLVPGLAHAEAKPLEVVIAKSVIYPGQTISEDMLRSVETMKSPPVGMSVVTQKDQLIGMIGVQTILPGRFISTSHVRPPAVINSGDLVTVTFAGAGFSIALTGIALQEAGFGETLLVRNVETGKTIRGHVLPDGSIQTGGPR